MLSQKGSWISTPVQPINTSCRSMCNNGYGIAGFKFEQFAGLDIGYVPAGPDAFFSWSGQFGPQQFILCWPAGPEAFDRFFFFFFFFFFFNLAHNAVNALSRSPIHQNCTCTRPVRLMPFRVTILKICVKGNNTSCIGEWLD